MSSLFGVCLRAYLAGSWRIERQIDDRRAGHPQSFSGRATFTGERDDFLLYREDGTLCIGANTIRASQSHRWTFGDDHAEVTFADGRAFHKVVLDGTAAEAIHDCPPDFYRVRYRFERQDRWRQRWVVSGPRKDYTLDSVFTRLHPPSDPVQCPRN